MGNWLPWIIIGVMVVGGFFLLRGTVQAISDPNVQKVIHQVTSQQFKQIVEDKAAGRLTDEQYQAKIKALSTSAVNFARGVY